MREPSTMKIIPIGVDLAKSVFQVHGVDAAGQAMVRKKLPIFTLAAMGPSTDDNTVPTIDFERRATLGGERSSLVAPAGGP
jgi:hypothetical protein